MTVHKKIPHTHDDVLEEIAAQLDIPPSKLEEAKERYDSLGSWLDRPESSLAAYHPVITPQGSILLGTVTRPLTATEEYDIDLVCLLKASKKDVTQKDLKQAVGHEILLYARAHDMNEKPQEGRRCWTVNYADGAQFHMDVLPAIPDAERYRLLLEQAGYRNLARDPTLTGQAIAITCKSSPQYAYITDDWPESNPLGYAAWFRSRMAVRLTELKKALASRQLVTASVEDIPDHKVKTPLQRAIQLLKRHRDCMFIDDCEHKPISIIITTLAAHAYNNQPTISGALQSILQSMDQYVEDRPGVAWVANPVRPTENFADRWSGEPQRRENFFLWLKQARSDFALYLRASRFDQMPDELKENLGADVVDRVLNTVVPAAVTGIAAPAIIKGAAKPDDMRRAESAIEEIRRTGTQSKPWVRS